MRHMSPGRLDRIPSTNARTNRDARSRPDEPPIKNPERLSYLLKLLQHELSIRKSRKPKHLVLIAGAEEPQEWFRALSVFRLLPRMVAARASVHRRALAAQEAGMIA